MIIHILFIQTLQLHSPSVLIYLVNVTLTTKSTSHILQFVGPMADIYHTAVGLEKNVSENREQTENGEQTENREFNYGGHSYPRGSSG